MSAECCGDDTVATPKRPLIPPRTQPQPTATDDGCTDGCCAPVQGAPSSPQVDDGDACCGPSVTPTSADGDERIAPWWRDRALLPALVAGPLVLAGTAMEWLDVPGAIWLQAIALLLGAWTFVPGAIRRLLRGRLGVGLLMTIAAAGAVVLGHVGEAAALAFLFSLAEGLEDRAMARAKDGLHALLRLVPRTARIERAGVTVSVEAADIAVGDVLVVGAGELVSTDGTVVDGRSSLDTSAVTGESIPVEAGPGDEVLAGSVNGSGTLRIAATAGGRDNSLTQIVELVRQAHALKGDRARLADRIAKPLVPAILAIAAAVVAYGFVVGDPLTWTERALVVLVAASPCALAIAVPVTVISAIGAASRFGVVIKSGVAFEDLGSVRAVAFDKTGTLTRNAPEVVDVVTADGFDRSQVLATAAALEASSSHPLAAAIVAAGGVTAAATDVHEQPGLGVTGTIDGVEVRVGSVRWLHPGTLSNEADRMAAAGSTTVVVMIDSNVAAIIAVRDELRDDAPDAIRALELDGILVSMLTGDNRRTAHALASRAGIADVHAEQRPDDKAAFIVASTAQRPTAMIGDGINDAPALAAATVGIAMGATGSAAAIESADVAFTGNDLRLIPAALRHARRGRRIMTTNIVLALLIIGVLFPLALFGVLGLAGVVLVHEIAEVVVIANGARAARRPKAVRAVERRQSVLA